MKLYASSYDYKGHKIYDKNGYWYIREEVDDRVSYPHFATDKDAEEYIDSKLKSERIYPRYLNVDYINSMFLDSASLVGYNEVEDTCIYDIKSEYSDISEEDMTKISDYLDSLMSKLTEKDFVDVKYSGHKLPVVYTGTWLE